MKIQTVKFFIKLRSRIKPNEDSIGRCFNFQPGEKFYLIFGKVSSVILGLLCIGFAYIASQLGGILEASLRHLMILND